MTWPAEKQATVDLDAPAIDDFPVDASDVELESLAREGVKDLEIDVDKLDITEDPDEGQPDPEEPGADEAGEEETPAGDADPEKPPADPDADDSDPEVLDLDWLRANGFGDFKDGAAARESLTSLRGRISQKSDVERFGEELLGIVPREQLDALIAESAQPAGRPNRAWEIPTELSDAERGQLTYEEIRDEESGAVTQTDKLTGPSELLARHQARQQWLQDRWEGIYQDPTELVPVIEEAILRRVAETFAVTTHKGAARTEADVFLNKHADVIGRNPEEWRSLMGRAMPPDLAVELLESREKIAGKGGDAPPAEEDPKAADLAEAKDRKKLKPEVGSPPTPRRQTDPETGEDREWSAADFARAARRDVRDSGVDLDT